jgi:cytochrome c
MRIYPEIAGLLVLLGGCAANGPHGAAQIADPAVVRGRAFVQQSCAGCHAIGPRGDSPDGRAPPFRTLSQRLGGRDLAPVLAEISRNGHVQMPPIYITDPEIKDVAAYIRTVEAEAARLPKAGQAALRPSSFDFDVAQGATAAEATG